jgi:hypothetical protein
MKTHKNQFYAGDTVAIPFGIGLWHYGVVTSRGTVISNSRRHGGVVEQSIGRFGDGKKVRLCKTTDSLGAVAAETRARKALGAGYNLTSSNCAHFARWSHRRNPTTLQVASATVSAFGDLRFGSKRRRY